MKKSNYFRKKYKKTQINTFYLFTYSSTSKAEVNSDLNRLINLNKLKSLILPSSFKIVEGQIIQGPRIGIIYSNYLNFKKLSSIYNIKALSLELKNTWYIYDLLIDLQPYKTSLDLCSYTHFTINKKILGLHKYIKLAF